MWKDISESTAKSTGFERKIIPNAYRILALDTEDLLENLSSAPAEFSDEYSKKLLIIYLPMPDGGMQRFNIASYSMMEPALQARFPEIKTFSGQGIDDPTATVKLDWTSFGFHAMVLSPVHGSVWIDPYATGDTKHYISYRKSDLNPRSFTETGVIDYDQVQDNLSMARVSGGPCLAAQLRSYRLAVACTGEYAQAVGGTTPALLHSAIVTTVNRVNGVYEQEVAVRLVLVGNNNLVEFLNPATDPFAGNDDATILINESQTVINANIGSANYDIGHTFSTGGGGLAGLGVVCTANKARGITGLPNPVGDAYDIDFVAHEIGHQFGGNHTFNASTGNCSGNGSSSSNAEPGSGSTIMAYAGICNASNDLQQNSDPQFHAISFDQIGTFTRSGSGSGCGTVVNTGNTAPVVNAGANYTIPISTPFTLSGSATDAEGDALTYCWDEIDVGGPFGNWNAPSGLAPLFRSFRPVTIGSRTFPRMSDIAANITTIGEIKASYARNIKFRLTARDNRSGGAGICYAEMTVTTSGATAFTVTSQTTATNWTANGTNTATITWAVAGTTVAPFNVSAVDILFSADGGLTYPYTILSNTPNDGSQSITIPSIPTNKGRIMVKSIGNIFFNVNAGTITITSACSAEGAVVAPAASVTAVAGNAALNLGLAPQYSTAFSPAGTLESTDPGSNLAVLNTATSSCAVFANPVKYDAYTFIPSITATYTFTLTGVFPTVMNLYSNSFNPASACTNFLRSNGSFTSPTVSIGNTVTQALVAGNTYVLVISTFSDTDPTLPAPYTVAVSSATPAGGVIYQGSGVYVNPGASFSYAYVIVDNATGIIKGISATANLTNSSTYPAGSYSVYGLSYANSIVNLNSFVGGSLTSLATSVFNNPGAFCANFSKNVVSVNILAGPVPVQQFDLSARKSGKKVALSWNTTYEQQVSHFNIQRSSDGSSFTHALGRVAAAGNTTSMRTYQFIDELPLDKWNYYRIEAMDFDGSRKWSNTAAVSFNLDGHTVFVYPNPVVHELVIDISDAKAGYVPIQVIDSKGAVLIRQSKYIQGGRNLIKINLSHLPSGVYILRYLLPGGEHGHIKVSKS